MRSIAKWCQQNEKIKTETKNMINCGTPYNSTTLLRITEREGSVRVHY
jgi:hypothetical protein